MTDQQKGYGLGIILGIRLPWVGVGTRVLDAGAHTTDPPLSIRITPLRNVT